MGNQSMSQQCLQFAQQNKKISSNKQYKEADLSHFTKNEDQYIQKCSQNEGILVCPGAYYYQGQMKDEIPNGKGLIRWFKPNTIQANLPKYEGNFNNGEADGQGKLTTMHYIFDGNWKKGEPINGKFCSNSDIIEVKQIQFVKDSNYQTAKVNVILPDDSNYNGQIKLIKNQSYKFSGNGLMTFKNLDTYDGNWVEGYMSGQGTYTWKLTKKEFKGQFKDNQRHGKGSILVRKGLWKVGNWQDGKLEGKVWLVEKEKADQQGKIKGQFLYKDGRQIKVLSNDM